MVIDKRTSQSSLESSVFELPPSYDFATALPSSQSSAGPSQESSDPTKHISHLFSCPPNVEPLLGRSLAPAQIIAEIESSKRGNGLMSLDPRLADRMSENVNRTDKPSRRAVRLPPRTGTYPSRRKASLYR